MQEESFCQVLIKQATRLKKHFIILHHFSLYIRFLTMLAHYSTHVHWLHEFLNSAHHAIRGTRLGAATSCIDGTR